MKKPVNRKIPRSKAPGKKTFILVFDGKTGKHTKNASGQYVLNPKTQHECISLVDAREMLKRYFHPSKIPTYSALGAMVKKEKFISVTELNGRYILG